MAVSKASKTIYFKNNFVFIKCITILEIIEYCKNLYTCFFIPSNNQTKVSIGDQIRKYRIDINSNENITFVF